HITRVITNTPDNHITRVITNTPDNHITRVITNTPDNHITRVITNTPDNHITRVITNTPDNHITRVIANTPDNHITRVITNTPDNHITRSWDDEVAMVAQRYADACKVNIHDSGRQRSIPGRLSAGQNLAAASTDIGWAAVVQLWHSEVSKFKTGGGNALADVGHYTQVVWADSIKLGCGYAQCGNMRNYVCNYAPAGNFDIDNPYTRGASCSECPNHCEDNLCDCNGLVCQNGGTLDKATCTCTCKTPPLYFGSRCDLNCSVADPNNCRLYQQSDCDTYSNVPQDCPNKCNVCPSAGVSFVDPSQTDDSTSESPKDDSSMIPSSTTTPSSFTNSKSSYTPTKTMETVSSNHSTKATIASSTVLNTVSGSLMNEAIYLCVNSSGSGNFVIINDCHFHHVN
ncbi:hypothetical protein FSP39_012803, partial [Pinctada imbricata]